MKKKPRKVQLGKYGVVGTWRNKGNPLGGIMPIYLSQDKNDAKLSAKRMTRHIDFAEENGIEFYLCEITLKPIEKLTSKKVVEQETKGIERVIFRKSKP